MANRDARRRRVGLRRESEDGEWRNGTTRSAGRGIVAAQGVPQSGIRLRRRREREDFAASPAPRRRRFTFSRANLTSQETRGRTLESLRAELADMCPVLLRDNLLSTVKAPTPFQPLSTKTNTIATTPHVAGLRNDIASPSSERQECRGSSPIGCETRDIRQIIPPLFTEEILAELHICARLLGHDRRVVAVESEADRLEGVWKEFVELGRRCSEAASSKIGAGESYEVQTEGQSNLILSSSLSSWNRDDGEAKCIPEVVDVVSDNGRGCDRMSFLGEAPLSFLGEAPLSFLGEAPLISMNTLPANSPSPDDDQPVWPAHTHPTVEAIPNILTDDDADENFKITETNIKAKTEVPGSAISGNQKLCFHSVENNGLLSQSGMSPLQQGGVIDEVVELTQGSVSGVVVVSGGETNGLRTPFPSSDFPPPHPPHLSPPHLSPASSQNAGGDFLPNGGEEEGGNSRAAGSENC